MRTGWWYVNLSGRESLGGDLGTESIFEGLGNGASGTRNPSAEVQRLNPHTASEVEEGGQGCPSAQTRRPSNVLLRLREL